MQTLSNTYVKKGSRFFSLILNMHPVPGRRIFGCFGSNFAPTGVWNSVGCLSVLAQSALISAETTFNFVGGGALHIVIDMGIYVQRCFRGNMSYDRSVTGLEPAAVSLAAF